jgi:hypothetical protein
MKKLHVLILSITLLSQTHIFGGWFDKKRVTEETPLMGKPQYKKIISEDIIVLKKQQYPLDGFSYFYRVISEGDKDDINAYLYNANFIKRTPSWVFEKAQQFTESDDLKERLQNLKMIKENPELGF